ncbi:MAG: hypothetical protein P4N59_24090 [Negativicutes bacterium]|nr:hypothetical protein [Negativicutes bacterium]
MKNISNMVVVFLLVVFISTGVVASEVGEALILESEGGSVIYKNKKTMSGGRCFLF